MKHFKSISKAAIALLTVSSFILHPSHLFAAGPKQITGAIITGSSSASGTFNNSAVTTNSGSNNFTGPVNFSDATISNFPIGSALGASAPLSLSSGTLSLNLGTGIGLSGTNLTNTGVLSFDGLTGAVVLSGSNTSSTHLILTVSGSNAILSGSVTAADVGLGNVSNTVSTGTYNGTGGGNVVFGGAGQMISITQPTANLSGTGTLDIGTGGSLDKLVTSGTQNIYWISYFISQEDKNRDAVTFDGITYYPIGGVSGTSQARDPKPFIWTKYSKVFTTGYSGNTYLGGTKFGLATSPDFINWNESTVSCTDIPNINLLWSPTPYIQSGTLFVFFTSSTDSGNTLQHYYKYTTDPNLSGTSWSSSIAVTGTFRPKWIIDDIKQISGTYQMWGSDVTSASKEIATSTTLTGSYVLSSTGNWAGWGSGKEGGSIINTSGSNWISIVDQFTNNGLYYATSTDNAATWSSLSACDTTFASWSNPGIIALTTPQAAQDIKNAAALRVGRMALLGGFQRQGISRDDIMHPLGYNGSIGETWAGHSSGLGNGNGYDIAGTNAVDIDGQSWYINAYKSGGIYYQINPRAKSWIIEVLPGPSYDKIHFLHSGTSSTTFVDAFSVSGNGNTTIPGNLTVSGTSTITSGTVAPGNTTTPLRWEPVVSSGTIYYRPLYQ